tara:strand:+ start:6101 stop:6469 length:369 start_codon:yes stop_codon:yes gene_type:complete
MKYLSTDKKGCYWLRRVIPKELQSYIGKIHLQKSLGVHSASNAEVVAPPVLSEWQKLIASATEEADKASAPTLHAEEILRTKRTASGVTDEEYEVVQDWVDSARTTKESKERQAVVSGMFVE